MVGTKARAELDKKLEQARQVMLEIMDANHSGSVTIGYGSGGLRIEHSHHEPPVPVVEKPEPIDTRIDPRSPLRRQRHG